MNNNSINLDKIKFIRWLNIRKTTLNQLNKDLKKKINLKITLDNCENVGGYTLTIIADYLDINPSKISRNNLCPDYILKYKREIDNTKRPIIKDGIHFYNYYTLPTPKGYVAPVLLDIMCPKSKLPKLNNGHLEPAITVSMGPNDIYARFDEKLKKDTWIKFGVNKDKKTNWILGSSYFEPSFCKHSYSRATNGLGRIISYTTKSNIESLLNDKLNNNSYKNFMSYNKNKKINRSLLKLELENRGYSIEKISSLIRVPVKKIKNYFKNSNSKLDIKNIRKICNIINIEPFNFLEKKFKEDSVGKSYLSYKDSIKTIRKFKSYKVASIANSKRFPDLTGYFMKVFNKKKIFTNDIFDSKCSHYFVTSGKIRVNINAESKKISKNLREGDCLWMSAFTYHGFVGNGSLLKISDGQNINNLEKEDLINTYKLNDVLKRTKNDIQNWGHDEK